MTKITKKLIKIKSPIFIKNYWCDELKLIDVALEGKVFTYHHLEHFFPYSFDIAFNEISNSLQNRTISSFRPIRFFIEAINCKEEANLFSIIQKQTLLHAKEAANILNNTLNNFSPRYKIKADYKSILLFLSELKLSQSINTIFDFNSNLTTDQFLEIHQKVLQHKNISLVYYEDPLSENELSKLSKETLKYIALDELLHRDSPYLNSVEWLVIKPAMIDEIDLEYYLSLNKKINLSSCYESPSMHGAYIKYLNRTNNDIHGIFEKLPE